MSLLDTLARSAARLTKRANYPMMPGMMPGYGMMGQHFRPGGPMAGFGMPMGGMGMGGYGGGLGLAPGMAYGHGGMFPGYGPPARNPMAGPGYGGSLGSLGGYGMHGVAHDEDSLQQEYESQKNHILQLSGAAGWSTPQIDQEINKLNTFYGRRLSSMREIARRYGTGSNRGGMSQPPAFQGGGGGGSPFGGGGGMPPPGPMMGGYGSGYSGGMPSSAGTGMTAEERELQAEIERERERQHTFAKENNPGAQVKDADLLNAYNALKTQIGNTSNADSPHHTLTHPVTGAQEQVNFAKPYWLGLSDNRRGLFNGNGTDETFDKYKSLEANYNSLLAKRKEWKESQQGQAAGYTSRLPELQAQLAKSRAAREAQQQEMQSREKADYERQRMLQDFYARRQLMPQSPAGPAATPSYAAPPSLAGAAPAAPAPTYAAPPAAPASPGAARPPATAAPVPAAPAPTATSPGVSKPSGNPVAQAAPPPMEVSASDRSSLAEMAARAGHEKAATRVGRGLKKLWSGSEPSPVPNLPPGSQTQLPPGYYQGKMPPSEGLGISPALLASLPLAGAVGGAGVGAATAPSEYAPEGALRGVHTGLAAGAGIAGGGLAGHLIGKGLNALPGSSGGSRFHPGNLVGHPKFMGGLGAVLGGLAGPIWSSQRQPHKPWERGERPVMEQLDTALQTRRPAPSFEPGYMGPAAFLTSKAGGMLSGMDEDEKRDRRAKGLVGGATRGGAVGSVVGSGVGGLGALLAAALERRQPGRSLLAHARPHAPRLVTMGAGGGLVGGTAAGAVDGLNQANRDIEASRGLLGKGAASVTAKVPNGMVDGAAKRKKKQSPEPLDGLDELMADLSGQRLHHARRPVGMSR